MEMQVEDRLTRSCTRVRDQAIRTFEPLALRDRRGKFEQFSQEWSVTRSNLSGGARSMFFRDQQHMDGSGGIDVLEREDIVGLGDPCRTDVAADDRTEDAVLAYRITICAGRR